ncbi:MAG TPA: prolyl oligopeptidase family serine peptidase [Gemmatimonadaceae bacterium]|nr:prolyl oligopeptidase family serine peptidase [Gemmatimonadaceae bacterium]
MPQFNQMRTFAVAAMVSLLASSANAQIQQSQKLNYPETKKVDQVDDFFGTKVTDPYRWMEDLNATDVADWVKQENTVTEQYFSQLGMRAQFKNRITELWNYPKVGLPFRVAGRLFYARNTGLQRQSVFFSRTSLGGPAKLVLDPNTLSADGSIALAGLSPSPDGKYLAYGISEGGADWRTLLVRELESGKQLADTVRWLKGGGMSWTKDGKGFYYSRFPQPEAGKQLQNAIRDEKIFYHRIGTAQAQDVLIYERPDHPDWFVGGGVTEDGHYLLVFVNRGTEPQNRLYFADLGDPKQPKVDASIRPLFDKGDAAYSPIGNVGSTIYMQTDRDAERSKVVAFDIASPEQWRTVVPEQMNAIDQIAMFKGGIAVNYLEDVKAHVRLYDLDGKALGDLSLPGIGSLQGFSTREDSPDILYGFTSPLYPSTVFRFDPATKKSTPFEAPKLNFDASQYETRALFATSKDGTRVPLFVTMKKGLALDGNNPAMLYGYGGFDIATTPGFRPDVLAWLEQGGIWATASMRGGSEYGEAWHKAGMFERKQNVFDDFIAAAEYLVKEGYSSPAKLGIMGGSNGGLLVGAVEEQRPDLFAVALPAVGVMDMLRYHKFTGGGAWATEYGSADDSTQFQYLVKYSPVHNVKAGTCYPATLITTADHDDRVVPSHSFKFAATMQAAQGCAKPVLIRVETQGSHGYRPTDKRIAELADEWAFTAAHTGVVPKVTP